jgi:hypothetical protein
MLHLPNLPEYKLPLNINYTSKLYGLEIKKNIESSEYLRFTLLIIVTCAIEEILISLFRLMRVCNNLKKCYVINLN